MRDERKQRGRQHDPQEIAGGSGQWGRLAASVERVQSPTDAGDGHQQCAGEWRRRRAGQQEPDEPTDRRKPAEILRPDRAFSAEQRRADHGGLSGTEQDQGAGRGVELHIGKRKRDRVHEQRDGGAPAAAAAHGAYVCACRKNGDQRNRPRDQADYRETRRIDGVIGESETADYGVAGEGNHGERR